jgi:hypothetical protein
MDWFFVCCLYNFSFYSDENLQNDHYLISLMDDQGWVPISIVANFKRVCFLCTNYLECLYIGGCFTVNAGLCQLIPKYHSAKLAC